MIKELLISIILLTLNPICNAQEVGEIKEVKLILGDIPFSGDAIQTNFINSDTSEIISFNHMTWLDKHVSLYDFFHTYKDSCIDSALYFTITMIFIPKEVYYHVRYEGYIPTGEVTNQWILTSIVKSESEYEERVDHNENSFNNVISIVEGDLNKDGINDFASVTQDTLQENAPYKLEIFLRQENGDLKLIISSLKAIEPQFPNGREQHIWGNGFNQLSIHGGVLWIETEFIRGHMEHKFRYQNHKFELIGYTYVNSDGLGKMYLVDYNLSTGKRTETIDYYSSDEPQERHEKTIKLNPLPDLLNFEQYSNELY